MPKSTSSPTVPSSVTQGPTQEPTPERTAAQSRLTGRDRGFFAGRWFSFCAAITGALYTIRTQPNAWIELTAVALVSLGGWWLGLARWEWTTLVLTFSLILALEAMNTALEAVVDLVSPDYHPLAKIAKDAAAGGLAFAVLGSIVIAGIILGPKLWLLLRI